MIKTEIDDKQIFLYLSSYAHVPIVYLHTYTEIGKEVLEACESLACLPFHLVCISGLRWNDELSPWPLAADDDFGGQADAYCHVLIKSIALWAEKQISHPISRRIIAGYSMGGLFSLYALYKSDMFSDAIVVSGSLWYPDFETFAMSREFVRKPCSLYFSIGDKEKKTRNQAMRQNEAIMRRLEAFYKFKGIPTLFETNPGNHFADVAWRIAKGLTWTINSESR